MGSVRLSTVVRCWTISKVISYSKFPGLISLHDLPTSSLRKWQVVKPNILAGPSRHCPSSHILAGHSDTCSYPDRGSTGRRLANQWRRGLNTIFPHSNMVDVVISK